MASNDSVERVRRLGFRVVRFGLLIIVGFCLALIVYQVRIEGTKSVVHESILGGCERLNVVRLNDNASHEDSYLSFLAQHRFDEGAAKILSFAVTSAVPVVPRRMRARARRERSFVRRYVRTLERDAAQEPRYADDETWIPRTDCAKAVDQPRSYRGPSAVHFAERFPDPADLPVGYHP